MDLSFGGFILPNIFVLLSVQLWGPFKEFCLITRFTRNVVSGHFLFCFIMMPLFSQLCVFCWESSARFWFPFLPPSDPEKESSNHHWKPQKEECSGSCEGVPLNWINIVKCQLNVGAQAGFHLLPSPKLLFFPELRRTFKTAEKKRKWNGTKDGVTSICGLPQNTRMHFSLLNSRLFFLVIIKLFLI